MMRGEAKRIERLLDEVEGIFREASVLPVGEGKAIVDRAELLSLLAELRAELPEEVMGAGVVDEQCEAMISSAREEARRIVEEAKEEARALALETEIYRDARRRAEGVVRAARGYAREVAGQAEAYQGRVMEQLESWFEDSVEATAGVRRELQMPVVRRTFRRAEMEGEGWRRVSSA
ncbi:hypothetical protein [Rubrobacter naiadicus]|uniref:hypothetical protein n=1 Tax=Rubrobacter naiadicus TaxID=1392641 RepID=UPI0023605AB7|nr:hypothetical protein [Rubrobacter naiadicus]